MIRLTNAGDNVSIYINPENIVSIIGNTVKTTNYCYCVNESPEEVTRKMLEWRLAMERYKSMLNQNEVSGAWWQEKYFKLLAGLEEKP